MSRRFLPSNRTSPSVTSYISRPARTPASVLLPEPFGPMMACTSPALTVRSMPFRISRSPTVACRFLISSSDMYDLSDAAFETHAQQLLRFHRELHRELFEDLFAE